ncbi:MAG: GatB/YqeY domain-containing protein [Planctomycetia bacterium]|jgi:uncharacterized protein YqeY
MGLKERFEADVKEAMRAKDEVARDTLRLLLAEFKRLEVQEGKQLTPELELDVLLKAVKQRQQSIDEYEKAQRPELAAKEKAEQAFIQGYLPKAMGEDEAREALKALIAETGASSKKDAGLVMKAVMAKHRGVLDGKLAQKLLGELLP